MSERLYRVRIAGRRLSWTYRYQNGGRDRFWALEREDEKPIYMIGNVEGKEPGKRGAFEVKIVLSEKVIGRKRTLAEAMDLAEKDFATRHHGQVEGHWTSYTKTFYLRRELEKRIANTPKTKEYPGWVPRVCPFCGSKRVKIEHPPHTMAFDHQSMHCLHCYETVYVFVSYASG